MSGDIYEQPKLLSEYLLFHYGAEEEILPYPAGPRDALDFAVRTVTECVDVSRLSASPRALDIGCAVGRSAFELARFCDEVVGIDYSHAFISAARRIQEEGSLAYLRADEGDLSSPLVARVPGGIDRSRVRFTQGDAEDLPGELAGFDVVHAANLIDRLVRPRRFLEQLPALVRAGGQLILTSPYTWLSGFTPRENWLGGFSDSDGRPVRTFDALVEALAPAFRLCATRDLPFLIREHTRKFQWSVAQATVWERLAG